MAKRLRLDGPSGPIYSDQESLFGGREVIGFARGGLTVEQMPRDEANEIVLANHYSHRVTTHSYIHLAVVYRDEVVGVLQYGYAMNPASVGGVVAGTQSDEAAELNRMWVADSMPCNTESAAIALSVRLVRLAYPKIGWVQSFADERCRLLGGVYQACSFLYCGEHSATFYELDGEWFHNTALSNGARNGPRNQVIRDNLDRATPHVLRQFRYVKFLRPKFRRNLLLPVLPYPKPHAAGLGEKPPATSRDVQVQCLPAALKDAA